MAPTTLLTPVAQWPFVSANLYTLVVASALIGQYLLSVVADLLNLRAMRSDLPEEVSDTYDAQAYARSQDYARTRPGVVIRQM